MKDKKTKFGTVFLIAALILAIISAGSYIYAATSSGPIPWAFIINQTFPAPCPSGTGTFISALGRNTTCSGLSTVPYNLNMTNKNITNINCIIYSSGGMDCSS